MEGRIYYGTTPNPKDGNWQWRLDTDAAVDSAEPFRWGPEIEGEADMAEWRDYFAKRSFTLTTPWQDAPGGFKRAFRGYWELQPGGKMEVEQVDYFEGDPDAGPHTEERFVRWLECHRLKGRIVVAVSEPRVLADVNAAVEQVKDLLKEKVDERRREVMGTVQYWADFMAVDALREGDRARTGEAIRRHIMERYVLPSVRKHRPDCDAALKRWCPNGLLARQPDRKRKRVQFQEWAQIKTFLAGQFTAANPKHRPDLKRRVDFMDALVDATFPRFDFRALTKPPPH